MRPSESLRQAVLEGYAAPNRHDEAFVRRFFDDDPAALMVGQQEHEWYTGAHIVSALVETVWEPTGHGLEGPPRWLETDLGVRQVGVPGGRVSTPDR